MEFEKLLLSPQKTDNKYSRGQCIIAGAPLSMSGASILASKAALRAGAGIVKLFSDEESMLAYAISLPSVVKKYYEYFEETIKNLDKNHSAILLGPGASGGNLVQNRDKIVKHVEIAANSGAKLLLDADALNVFEGNPEFLKKIVHKNVIITPHEGEFKRLFGQEIGEDKKNVSRETSKYLGCIVLLKGNTTIVSGKSSQIWVNKSASTNLATAGSGDVLSGIITAFMARGLDTFEAAKLGVFTHSEAAKMNSYSMTSEELADSVGKFLDLQI